MIDISTIEKIDLNNMKALAVLKHILFCLDNGCDTTELDVVTALETVLDYLVENNKIFNEST